MNALAHQNGTVAEARPAPADNPLAMLGAALASGQDPAKLEKLMDLADRWKASQAAEAFATALNLVQSEMPCVVKDGKNTHTQARYATLENVQTVIRPVYSRHGFSLSYGTEDSKLADHVRVVCDVSHVGGCTRRYHLDCPMDGTGAKGGSNKTGVQAVGSSISYARRYLTLMIFNITVANEDVDGNAADALDTITEADCLDVEGLLADKQVDYARFLEWGRTAGVFIPNAEPAVRNIGKKNLAKVLDILNRKPDRKGGAK